MKIKIFLLLSSVLFTGCTSDFFPSITTNSSPSPSPSIAEMVSLPPLTNVREVQKQLKIQPLPLAISVDDPSLPLQVEVTFNNGQKSNHEPIQWQISNENIVAIDENNHLQPLKEGTVTITAILKSDPQILDSVALAIVKVVPTPTPTPKPQSPTPTSTPTPIPTASPPLAKIVGTIDTLGYTTGVAISGNYAYLADSFNGIQIIDISQPAKPMLVGTLKAPLLEPKKIVIADHFAYVADGSLRVLDINTPTKPQLIASLNLTDLVYHLTLSGHYLYLTGEQVGLQIVDISTPKAPTLVASLSTPGVAAGVAANDSHVYMADGESGLQIIDISTPTTPTILTPQDKLGKVTDVAIFNNYAYVTNELTLSIFDISQPSLPTSKSVLGTPGSATKVVLSGNLAFIADDFKGLQIADIGQPEKPSLIGSVDTPGLAGDVFIAGNYAYVADGSSGLQIIDISAFISK